MADDTNQQGAADRSQVAAGEGYEVAYFASKHGLTQAAAQELISEIGNDREKLDAAAEARKPAKRVPAKPAATGTARSSAKAKPKPAARRKSAATPARRTRVGTGLLDTAAAAPTLATLAEPIAATADTIRRRVSAAAKPVTDSVSPAAIAVAKRAKTVAQATRRSSTAARIRVAAAPAAIRRGAATALESTKSAATSRTAALIGAAAAGLVTGLAVNLGRKAVVQAPSVMAGDWLEALKGEHLLALTLFDQLEQTSDSQPAQRAVLLTQLKHALGKHAFTEENVIYPALRDWGDKADADKLNHDHGYVKQYLYELEALDKESPAFLSRLAAFRADLEAHIREEEDAVFPPLHTALGDAKNAEITALANKEGFKLA